MEPAQAILILFASYVLGSIPSAYVAGRIARGIDIRAVGSHNVGALNIFHQVGPGTAIAVLAADTLKGSSAILISTWLGDSDWASFYGGIGVAAGHNWPVFLGFRGGKGAATVLGVSLTVAPWLTLMALAPSVLAALLARNVVLGTALGFILLNALIILSGQGMVAILLCLFLALIVTATYLGRSWHQTVSALRQRDLLALFSFE